MKHPIQNMMANGRMTYVMDTVLFFYNKVCCLLMMKCITVENGKKGRLLGLVIK